MGGRTTAGRATSINSGGWTGIYQKFIASWNTQDELKEEIEQENNQLFENLRYLERYYDGIWVFCVAARDLNLSPRDIPLRESLQKKEDELCSNDMLLKYLYAAIGALRALASIAKKADGYIRSQSGKLIGERWMKGEQIIQLTVLLNQVKSISKNVKDDFVAEVKTSPGGALGTTETGPQVWGGYVSARRQSLRKAGGIEHLE
jgi:hypothetical protein